MWDVGPNAISLKKSGVLVAFAADAYTGGTQQLLDVQLAGAREQFGSFRSLPEAPATVANGVPALKVLFSGTADSSDLEGELVVAATGQTGRGHAGDGPGRADLPGAGRPRRDAGQPRDTAMNLSRQPAYWLFVLLVFAGLGLVGAEQASYFVSYPGAWFLSILLLAAVAIPVGIIIYRIDQFEPEPVSLIVIALVWGGVVALSFAAVVNSSFLGFFQHLLPTDEVNSWGAALVAPIDEEFYKGAGLVMIFLIARREIDGLMDGLVYGAMIGLGFQVVENVQYFVHAAAQSGGTGLGAVVGMFFVRVLIAGLYSHMLFTGLLGFGFAYFITRRGSATWTKRAGVFAIFIVASWAAHFVWNSPWLDSLAQGSVGRSSSRWSSKACRSSSSCC